MKKKKIDLVVAVRNEEENIPNFIHKVINSEFTNFHKIGIIFVEDSSKDSTVNILRKFSKEYTNIRFFSLVKGFGQAAAIAFGISKSEADAIIMMDVDGGHPIDIIPEIISCYEKGFDIVQCVRKPNKHRKIYRKLGAFFLTKYAMSLQE